MKPLLPVRSCHDCLKEFKLISSRRMYLRDRTAPAHDALDKLVGPFDSIESYRWYVSGIAAFRRPLEAELSSVVWSDLSPDYQLQRLGDLLVEDMNDLALIAGTVTTSVAAELVLEELLGTLYVVEGSALGSRILYRRAQALGMTDGHGARHLAVQSRPGPQWQSYLSVLETGTLDMELVALSATRTFQAAEQAFRNAGANALTL